MTKRPAPMPPGDRKKKHSDVRLRHRQCIVRLTNAERDAIAAGAAAAGDTTIAAYMRRLALVAARRAVP